MMSDDPRPYRDQVAELARSSDDAAELGAIGEGVVRYEYPHIPPGSEAFYYLVLRFMRDHLPA